MGIRIENWNKIKVSLPYPGIGSNETELNIQTVLIQFLLPYPGIGSNETELNIQTVLIQFLRTAQH